MWISKGKEIQIHADSLCKISAKWCVCARAHGFSLVLSFFLGTLKCIFNFFVLYLCLAALYIIGGIFFGK